MPPQRTTEGRTAAADKRVVVSGWNDRRRTHGRSPVVHEVKPSRPTLAEVHTPRGQRTQLKKRGQRTQLKKRGQRTQLSKRGQGPLFRQRPLARMGDPAVCR